jgi:hypothetical protein
MRWKRKMVLFSTIFYAIPFCLMKYSWIEEKKVINNALQRET